MGFSLMARRQADRPAEFVDEKWCLGQRQVERARHRVERVATAGKGDVGFCGNWTLEISVKKPVRVYAGMPIGQLIYFPVLGEILVPYNSKKNAKYAGQPNRPVESMMWKNNF